MTDENDDLLPTTVPHLPAVRADGLRPSVPSLPASSGAIFGSPTRILQKDKAFVEAHTGLLRAQADQADAMRGLVESKQALALTVSKLVALPEIAQHQQLKGRLERAAELRLTELKSQISEVNAQAALAAAQQKLAAYNPAPAPVLPPSPPPQSASPIPLGLTLADVKEISAHLPEISPEALEHLALLLAGRLKEKEGGRS